MDDRISQRGDDVQRDGAQPVPVRRTNPVGQSENGPRERRRDIPVDQVENQQLAEGDVGRFVIEGREAVRLKGGGDPEKRRCTEDPPGRRHPGTCHHRKLSGLMHAGVK